MGWIGGGGGGRFPFQLERPYAGGMKGGDEWRDGSVEEGYKGGREEGNEGEKEGPKVYFMQRPSSGLPPSSLR